MALGILQRRKNETGVNKRYKLTDGRVVTREEAVLMCRRGELQGCHVIEDNGVEYLRGNPDIRVEDNIENKPIVDITKILATLMSGKVKILNGFPSWLVE